MSSTCTCTTIKNIFKTISVTHWNLQFLMCSFPLPWKSITWITTLNRTFNIHKTWLFSVLILGPTLNRHGSDINSNPTQMWHTKYISCTLHNYVGIKSKNYVQAHLMKLFKSHKLLQHGPWRPWLSGSLSRSTQNHKESHEN
jgi:hypothetical protein